MSAPARPPGTRREEIVETLHGVEVRDPYRWLEDAAAPEVQAWMTAQDEHTRRILRGLPEREAIVGRLRELFYYDAVGAPSHRQGRYFWSRKHSDKEKTVVYWKQGEDGDERVLFDPNTWSDDGSVSLAGWWPSWDGRFVAYNVTENNADEATMHVLDVASGTELGDVIAGTKYTGASWTPDAAGFYYTWVPPVGGEVTIPNRPGFAELRYHALGAEPGDDAQIHPATGSAETFLGGGVSRDGRWLLVSIHHGWNATDVYLRGIEDSAWTPLVEGIDATFDVTIWRDRGYVLTNHDAPRSRVMGFELARPQREHWTEIVAQDAEATLDSLGIVGGRLVLGYLRKAASEVAIRSLDGALVRTLALPGTGTTGGISGLPDEDTGYFSFTSFTEPGAIYRTSIASGETTEWTRVVLPVDTSRFVTEQVTYASKDGTPITMFLLHRDDVVADGTAPTILYGYGGFNVSLTPAFASSRMVWLERGGVYAIPNLRGGGEYGEDWHRAGMLLEKQNVFDDFIAAGRWLIEHRWTSPERLAISGGSNGGLLVGATMTQAPELCRAVICAVPLLDMLRYQLFGSGKTWVPEYGSADDPAQFAVLQRYSPYHHVVDGVRYPALLMLAADSDDRVDPMHARKLAAAVQQASSSGLPVLLRIERNAGHGGADLVKQQLEQSADTFVFLFDQLRR